MTEHNLLFTAPMIRAMKGRQKTQTRRILTRRNTRFDGGRWPNWVGDDVFDWAGAWVDDGPSPAGNPGPYLHLAWPENETTHRIYPRYQPGDTIWAKETFWQVKSYPSTLPSGESDDGSWGPLAHCAADGDPPNTPNRHYPDGLKGGHFAAPDPYAVWLKRPSIFMYRAFSRLTSLVTKVRVERVQEISDEDAIAEGISAADSHLGYGAATAAYAELWNRINGPEAWESNPWVLAIDYVPLMVNVAAVTPLLSELLDLYTPVEAGAWLTSPHPMLNDQRADDVIAAGDLRAVANVVEGMCGGAHV